MNSQLEMALLPRLVDYGSVGHSGMIEARQFMTLRPAFGAVGCARTSDWVGLREY